MDYLWRAIVISILIAGCLSDKEAPMSGLATVEMAAAPCVKCHTTTTKHPTTSTLHTTHTTDAPTTAHTNQTTVPTTAPHTSHSTVPSTTAHANITTALPTTAHTNHTTVPPTTTHPNHTTVQPTTAHTNHTTVQPTMAHTNHTTAPTTTAHTNHTTVPTTMPHTNHTMAPPTTPHTNHTTAPPTTPHTNHTTAPPTTPHTNHTTAHTNHTSRPTSEPVTNQTTAAPTTAPSPSEYFVNGTAGVCLRIRAIFTLMFNSSKQNYIIPPPPITKHTGNCNDTEAALKLTFPLGSLGFLFKKDKSSSFYLDTIRFVTKDRSYDISGTQKVMETPLGHSYKCKEVDVNLIYLKVMFEDVKAQAFQLENGNFGPEMDCHHSNVVPIVVGIVLVVLIIAVVAAYLISRHLRHRAAGYQPL